MASRVIQTFVDNCRECPRCNYYSGGVYVCTLTDERILPDVRGYEVGKRCPLPFAGPIDRAAGNTIKTDE